MRRLVDGRFEALVFDFDGLILDTELPALRAWQEVYEQHGVALDEDIWCRFIGTGSSIFDLYAYLEELIGQPVERDAILPRRRERMLELLAVETIRPGVEAWLDEADRRRLGLAVASSSPRDWVEEHLARLGLRERFGPVFGRDDVGVPKPAPDLYVAATGALGVAPERALAIEDSPRGAESARLAGLYCVAVPNQITRRLTFDHADLVVDSLAVTNLAEVERRLARFRGA
jgi:HAD superfamily hydrolase (TIGR01509 family)